MPQRCDKGLITFAYMRMGPTVHSSGATSFMALIDFLHASLLQTAVICASVGIAIDVGSYPASLRHVVTFPVTRSLDNAAVLQGAAATLEKAATSKSRLDPNAMCILCNNDRLGLEEKSKLRWKRCAVLLGQLDCLRDCATRCGLETGSRALR